MFFCRQFLVIALLSLCHVYSINRCCSCAYFLLEGVPVLIKQEFFESLFDRGMHLVHGLKANMKNKLIPMWDKIMLRKRYVIECINELLTNKANSTTNCLLVICSRATIGLYSERLESNLGVR